MNRCVGIVLNVPLWMGGLMRLTKGTIFWKTRVTWLLDINSMTRSFITGLPFYITIEKYCKENRSIGFSQRMKGPVIP